MTEHRTVTREQLATALHAVHSWDATTERSEADAIFAALPASDSGLLRRNVLINDDHGFKGAWVAVPREDFDRAVMALGIAPSSDGGLRAAAVNVVAHWELRGPYEAFEAAVEALRAALAASPDPAGTTVHCSQRGVHAHSFRGPHRFHEWEPGT